MASPSHKAERNRLCSSPKYFPNNVKNENDFKVENTEEDYTKLMGAKT